MSVALGFGSNEISFEDGEEQFIRDWLKARSHEGFVFTDELARELKLAIKERAAEYQAKADVYKDAEEYPDRYSYYWARIVNGACDLCVIVTFHHVNRKHALSSDGWGMMRNKRVFHFDYDEFNVLVP